MNKKIAAAGGAALLIIILVGAVVLSALGVGKPAAAQMSDSIENYVGYTVVGNGFDPEHDMWYLDVSDCGGPLTSETAGDMTGPESEFLPTCGPLTRVKVNFKLWNAVPLGALLTEATVHIQ